MLTLQKEPHLNCCIKFLKYSVKSKHSVITCNSQNQIMVPGSHGRPQAWARGGGVPPLRKCCKVFCALVVTVKRSVDELFMHYFHNLSSTSGSFAPKPLTCAPFLDSAGGLLSPDP